MPDFTYMGTKKNLAETISGLCRRHRPGPFLDLFSGISAAGAAIAPERQIWCNDAQVFSRTLTEALYLSEITRVRASAIIDAMSGLIQQNAERLIAENYELVEQEKNVIYNGPAERQIRIQFDIHQKLQEDRTELENMFSHCLFTTRYAGTYLGLHQAIQIDSIRFGADHALQAGKINAEEHRWTLLAMCRSLALLSNSTGHFAQYLTPSEQNIRRVLSQRRRCAVENWQNALGEMKPIGTKRWRSRNRVFHGDAVDVLRGISSLRTKPAIIYADPPYTDDQYSRYYHLFETALLYDYPETTGKGLYRDNRFRSSFSLARGVEDAFREMISTASETGSALIISYPTNGLMKGSLELIPQIMAAYFTVVCDPVIIPYKHSTLGASKGKDKEDVEECIFVATRDPLL